MQRTFGQELKRAAEEAGFNTQHELATASGISQGMIAKLYLDQRPNVSAAVLFKLCRAISVSCQHFEPYLSSEAEADPPPSPPPAGKPKRGRPRKT